LPQATRPRRETRGNLRVAALALLNLAGGGLRRSTVMWQYWQQGDVSADQGDTGNVIVSSSAPAADVVAAAESSISSQRIF